jgi:hypothetical protein
MRARHTLRRPERHQWCRAYDIAAGRALPYGAGVSLGVGCLAGIAFITLELPTRQALRTPPALALARG